MHAIDRQLSSSRFRLMALRWVGGPVMVLIVAYLSYFLYERGAGLTENVLMGLGGVGSSLLAGVGGNRTIQRQIQELEDERAQLQDSMIGSVWGEVVCKARIWIELRIDTVRKRRTGGRSDR